MNNQQLATQNSDMAFNPFNREQAMVLKEWATDLAYSDLVPEMYQMKEKDPALIPAAERKAVANSLIALNMSLRMGADVLMVMQNLVIVSSRPTFSAKFLTALVNSSGEYEPIEYRMENKGKIGIIKVPYIVWKILPGQNTKSKVTEYKDVDYSTVDNLTMVAYSRRKGSQKELISSEVSVKLAILEGWYDKNGSKWPNMTEKMLRYRSASFWISEFAPEKAMGMRSTEEEEDIVRTEDVNYVDVTNSIPNLVAEKIATEGNRTAFKFDEAKPVEGSQAEEPKAEEKAPETVKPEEKSGEMSSKITDPENDKPLDTLAKVGQENAAKEEEKQPEQKAPETAANAGIQPSFGFKNPS